MKLSFWFHRFHGFDSRFFGICLAVTGLIGTVGDIPAADPFRMHLKAVRELDRHRQLGLTTTRYGSPSHAATDSPEPSTRRHRHQPDAGSGARFVRRHASGAEFSTQLFARVRVRLRVPGNFDERRHDLAGRGAIHRRTDAMAREQVDLSAAAGFSDVRVRFRLVTDDSIVMDGWYVDDVQHRRSARAGDPPDGHNRPPTALCFPGPHRRKPILRRIASTGPSPPAWTGTRPGWWPKSRPRHHNFTDITVSPKTTIPTPLWF